MTVGHIIELPETANRVALVVVENTGTRVNIDNIILRNKVNCSEN